MLLSKSGQGPQSPVLFLLTLSVAMFRAIDPAYPHHDPHRVPGTVVYGRRDPPVGPSAARFSDRC